MGGEDHVVIGLNKKAYDLDKGGKADGDDSWPTHLFEEPGTLEEVARLAVEGFKKYLI